MLDNRSFRSWASALALTLCLGCAAAAQTLIALDPGHGGRDPGARHGGMVEKALTLDISLAMEAALQAAGYRVFLTRRSDVFISLDERIWRARRAGAGVFLSIHADAAPQADVAGASVYLYRGIAADAIARALARDMDGPDALAAGGYGDAGADVAQALSGMISAATGAQSEALGQALIEEIGARAPMLKGRPLRAARFRVLRAPDTPSALIELGFLSNAQDRARLRDPLWRAAVVEGVIAALRRVAPP